MISVAIIVVPIYPIYKPLSILYHIAVKIFDYIFAWQLAFFQNLFDSVATPADRENHYKNIIIPSTSDKPSWADRIYNQVFAGLLKENYYADALSTKHGRASRRRAERTHQFETQMRRDIFGPIETEKELKRVLGDYINDNKFDLYLYFAGDTGSRLLEKFSKGIQKNTA
jgi:hypothetical protein